MPDWSALRRRARRQHEILRARAFAGEELPPADVLLSAAEVETGLACYACPSGDSLLAGAQAVLDRDTGCIWYASNLPDDRRRFAQAHEFAHFWLHADVRTDLCEADDSPEALLSPSSGTQITRIAEGYSPRERRESEADLFALELLLPAPTLRRLFLIEGWNAARIAARSGLSESCVLSQLAQVLLTQDEENRGREETELPRSSLAPPVSHPSSFPLDSFQDAAARIHSGPVLVDAGPGTGKTRTLVARLLYLLTERRVAPENILALTFSNLAAEEMHTRLREQVGDLADRVWIGTFHAFGFEILRKDGQRIGLPLTPRLIELVDAVALLEQSLDRLDLDEYAYLHDPTLPFPDILSCISRAKDELKGPQEYRKSALALLHAAQDEAQEREARKALEAARVYDVYEAQTRARGFLDFGDLIKRAVELLDTCPDVQARWRAQFPHVLADEYQDINRASAQLLRRVAGDGQGFWAVGDLRQAIYRFRGASPANVSEFGRDFPGGQRLRLGVNYRSRAPIVGLFGAFASGMGAGGAEGSAAWETFRGSEDAPAVTLAEAEDEATQGAGIAARVREWEARGVPKSGQTVLCRTNRQASDLAERLEAHGVAAQHLGGLFDRDEVKDMLALLGFVSGEGGGLWRVARFPEYAVPEEDVERLWSAATQLGKTYPYALALTDDLPELTEEGRSGLGRLWTHLRPILHIQEAWRLLALYLFEESGYLRPLMRSGTLPDRLRLIALHQFLAFAQASRPRFEEVPDEGKLAAFLAYVRALLAAGESRPVRVPPDCEGLDAVRVLTVHASKGLEFPVVYLPNLAHNQFPARGGGRMATPPPGLFPGETGDDSDEELFFVALSRARDHLVLSYPKRIRGRKTEPSPLLKAIRGALEAAGAEPLSWRGEGLPSELENAPTKIDNERPSVTAWELEQYRECPRRYFYQSVARLPQRPLSSEFLAFRQSVQESVRWLEEERAAGHDPTEAEAQSQAEIRFDAALDLQEVSTPQLRMLRAEARAAVARAHAAPRRANRPTPPPELMAELPNGSVRVKCDEAETLPDGGLRLTRHKAGRATKDDHTDPRLALLREAGRQQKPGADIEIALRYLRDDTQRDVPASPRYEPARVAKYDEALAGIRTGKFPPRPDARRCSACPFLFVCPA